MATPAKPSSTPSFQFLSPNADDAKWLIWGKLLHKRGVRGSKIPASGVRVDITEHVVRVTGASHIEYWYTGNISFPASMPPTTIIRHVDPGIPSVTITAGSTLISSSPIPLYRTDIAYSFKDGDGNVVATSVGSAVPSVAGTYRYLDSHLSGSPFIATGYILTWTYTGILYVVGDSANTLGNNLLATLHANSIDPPNANKWQFMDAVVTGNATFTDYDGVLHTQAVSGTITAASPAYEDLITAGIAASDIVIQIPGIVISGQTDSFMTELKGGTIRNEVMAEMRSWHPRSHNTYQASLPTVSIVYGSIGSGDDVTNTVDVTVSYQGLDGNGNLVTHMQTVSGSQHVVKTWCADSLGNPNMASYITTTYVNWLPLDLSGSGSTGAVLNYTYVSDDAFGICQIWNGVEITGAATLAETFDSVGGQYNPPYLQTSFSVIGTYPQVYVNYRAATARLYVVGGETVVNGVLNGFGYATVAEMLVGLGYGTVAELFAAYGATSWTTLSAITGYDAWGLGIPDWLDSLFQDGEQIDIFPLSVWHSTLGDLGVFPDPADIADVTKLTFRATMKATFTYNYKTGEWVGKGVDLPSPVTLPYQVNTVVLFRSRTARTWPDIAGPLVPVDPATYKGQVADIKAHPASYPLFAPLLNS